MRLAKAMTFKFAVARNGLEESSSDPSRFTAWGVSKGIQATAKAL
ncbi:MAG: hypothetical protein ACXVAJ_05115 [Parachlamydiaceae bacterium]